jgi:cobalamin biosynthesis Co2+ chelatase CbiK
MKTKEEIEQLANEYAKQFDYAEDSSPFLDYIEGYEQCQEDMADKKYTLEDMFKVWLRCRIHSDEQQLSYEKELFNNFINSLNKQN